jgi:hypothetical protein
MTFIGTVRYGLSLLNVIIPPEDDIFQAGMTAVTED